MGRLSKGRRQKGGGAVEQGGTLRLEGIYRKGYGIVPKFVMHDRALSLESKAIYAYLCALAGGGAHTFPYRATILRQVGLSKNTYYRHYNPLIEQGYLRVERPADKTAANIYTLLQNPKQLAAQPAPPAPAGARLRYRGLKAHGYGTIPRVVMCDERLSAKAKGLYAYFCSYCGAGDCAFPRKDAILYHLGISEPTYYKAYAQLRELGYLTAVQRKEGSRFGVNDYYLSDAPAPPESPDPRNGDITPPDQTSPHIRNRDTTNGDTENGDATNSDAIKKKNSTFSNRGVISSPSNPLGGQGEGEDRKGEDGLEGERSGGKRDERALDEREPGKAEGGAEKKRRSGTGSIESKGEQRGKGRQVEQGQQQASAVPPADTLEQQVRRLADELAAAPPSPPGTPRRAAGDWLRHCLQQEGGAQRVEAVLAAFVCHFRQGGRARRAHNLAAYLAASLVNWLAEQPLRDELAAPALPGGGSYDLGEMQRMIEHPPFL